MKRQNTIWAIIVTLVMLIATIILLFYLPLEIAVQWNEGEVSGTAGKFLILAFPAISTVFLILHNKKSKVVAEKFDFVGLFVPLLLFAAEGIIALNALGHINMMSVNYRFLQTITLFAVDLIICVCGNHIPKFVKNFYCGVKSAFAYSNSDLWTKTQRFAGKLWFGSGLVIMLLSFIQWKGISILVLCLILCLILIPRVYGEMQYNKNKDNKM